MTAFCALKGRLWVLQRMHYFYFPQFISPILRYYNNIEHINNNEYIEILKILNYGILLLLYKIKC